MARYSFTTIWRIEAPITDVWNVISDVGKWPVWWTDVKETVCLKPGDSQGLGARWRYVFKSRLPYSLAFDSDVVRIEPPRILEGHAMGELEGTGLWQLSQEETITSVRYDWNVRTTKWWMEVLAPVGRPFFAWNHNATMEVGGKGLARHLNTRLVGEMIHGAH